MKPLERVALVLLLLFAGCCAGPQRQPHGSASEALYDACRSQCSIEAAQPIDPFVLVTAGHVYCFCHTPDAALERASYRKISAANVAAIETQVITHRIVRSLSFIGRDPPLVGVSVWLNSGDNGFSGDSGFAGSSRSGMLDDESWWAGAGSQ